jgi:hypothetical protein
MRGTRAADILEFKSAGSDEFAETPCCSSPELCLGGAAGITRLRGVEANEADVRVLVMDADGVSVQHNGLV